MEASIAGATAAVLTFFELDTTFYTPRRLRDRLRLYAWWFGFLVVNGALAALVYTVAKGRFEVLSTVDPWLGAILIGLGYLALVRTKVITFKREGIDIPVGFEFLYEGVRRYFFGRINRIARSSLTDDVFAKAESMSLKQLATVALNDVDGDALMSDDEKAAQRTWLLGVLKDAVATDEEKRRILARFMLTGRTSSSSPVVGLFGEIGKPPEAPAAAR
jgi:hypothetical protein